MYNLVLQVIISHVHFLFTEGGRLGAPVSLEVEVKHIYNSCPVFKVTAFHILAVSVRN